MRKITQEQANLIISEICTERDYIYKPFVYNGNLSRIEFICNTCSYEWDAYYSTFVNQRRGCAKCSGKLKLTQEEAESRIGELCKTHNIIHKPFVYISAAKTKIEFICQHGHTCNKTYAQALANPPCTICTRAERSFKHKQEYSLIADEKIKEMCIVKNCTVGDYTWSTPTKTFLSLTCNDCGFSWNTTSYNHFVNSKTKCTKCCPRGYNSGKPGYLYIHKITSYNSSTIFYKFGITGSYEDRLSQLSRRNSFSTEKYKAFRCEDGEVIKQLEFEIKKSIITGVLPKTIYTDGHTETFHSDDLESVLDIISQWSLIHNIESFSTK